MPITYDQWKATDPFECHEPETVERCDNCGKPLGSCVLWDPEFEAQLCSRACWDEWMSKPELGKLAIEGKESANAT